ncbi:MAG: Fic family protein [Parcubacteria group bacterium]|nr:Fic family protein [Parcubacteria group bacterium]MBI4087571.1 Fic family protein [Candidatus Liptonbacteria bacterium]
MSGKRIDFFTRFIVESDALEGIQADPGLVRSQLEKKYQKGHVGALLFLEMAAEKRKILNKNLVCRTQGLITAEQHTKPGGPKLRYEWIGRYRLINVSVGGRMSPTPGLIPSLMLVWIAKVVAWQKESFRHTPAMNLRRIAIFHYEYEHIHPFVDGNGRSGRALVYYLMRYCGVNPFVFTSDDKHETYYCCFDNPEAMCKYFEARMNG